MVSVSANATGAFSAVRVDVDVFLHGGGERGRGGGGDVKSDLTDIFLPLVGWGAKEKERENMVAGTSLRTKTDISSFGPAGKRTADVNNSRSLDIEDEDDDPDDREDSAAIKRDIEILVALCDLLAQDRALRRDKGRGMFDFASDSNSDDAGDREDDANHRSELPHGADVLIQLDSGFEFPAHGVLLAARCGALRDVLSGTGQTSVKSGNVCVSLRTEKRERRAGVKSAPGLGQSGRRIQRMLFAGCHPLSALLIVLYLYTDDIPAVWDRRIGMAVASYLSSPSTSAPLSPTNSSYFTFDTALMNPPPPPPPAVRPTALAQVSAELLVLARALRLSALVDAVANVHTKRYPTPSLLKDMRVLLDEHAGAAGSESSRPSTPASSRSEGGGVEEEKLDSHTPTITPAPAPRPRDPLRPDTLLALSDRLVSAHSLVLRVRSPFFSTFFADPVWASKRWSQDGTVVLDLQHVRWQAFEYVLKFIYCDDKRAGDELFRKLGELTLFYSRIWR